ncbi:MAG: lysophospholipid acyltransferase family protein [Desulfobacteraceae bacterium]|nr:lysophospholipid acyltransferase family protein [Desulfobacteraceae bacterium]
MRFEKPLLKLLEQFMDMAARIPRSARWRLAGVAASLWHRFDRRHRRIVVQNLERAYGDELTRERREEICRGVFNHLARVMLELPDLLLLHAENLDRFLSVTGLEHMEAACARNKGVLVLGSHFGNWEIMALGYSIKASPFNVIVRPLDNPVLHELIDGLRQRTGNQTIPKAGSVRRVMKLLHQGRIVAILSDQNVDWYDGVFVPFFKDVSCTNKALAVLSIRTGTPVVPVYNYREPDGRYRIVIEPEVPIIRTGNTISDIEENTAAFNRIIERYVREHPEQWLWMHQKWKTRPYQPWPRVVKRKC